MIVHPDIEKYLEGFRSERGPIIMEMEKRAEREDFPIIGPDVGNLLYLLAKIKKAGSVLELGSGFGYSALFFAAAIPETGKIVCTDMEEKNRLSAESVFREAGLKCRIEFLVGDAIVTAAGLNETFDIVYNDIDKEFYPETIDIAFERLNPGGLFITDNTLWYGRVISEHPEDEATASVIKFNNMLKEDKRFEFSIIPFRDGVTVAVKK